MTCPNDYAATVLHNLVQHMDLEPAPASGYVTLTAIIPAKWIPALKRLAI